MLMYDIVIHNKGDSLVTLYEDIMAMKNSAVTIRIPTAMKKELEELANDQNIPLSDLVRESLDHFLVVKRFRRIRSKLLPFAEAQGLLMDEEIFKIIS